MSTMMRRMKLRLLVALTAILMTPVVSLAGGSGEYTLKFILTQNVPADAKGTMTLIPKPEGMEVKFELRGASPSTVYTIWTVFNVLDEVEWQQVIDAGGGGVPSDPASSLPGFPVEGNGVTPTAALGSGFTHGMRADPGATFVTDAKGDGNVDVKLDYDLLGGEINGPPVSNRDIVKQCAPVPAISIVNGTPVCPSGSSRISISTLYLREFIGQYPVSQRGTMCANYDPAADPEVVGAGNTPHGSDARKWQCVDPATADTYGNGLARVPRFAFNHFRLANHPDALTHGHIGGNGFDHFIDMVGRRCDIRPRPADTPPCTHPAPRI